MFNALKYIKNLEAAGISREQAEAQVQLVIAAIEDGLVTKTEFAEFRSEVKAEFSEVRAEFAEFRSEVKAEFSEVKAEFAEFRSEVKAEFSEVKTEFAQIRSEISAMKADLVFKLGALFVGSNTVGFAMLGVLIAFVAHR